MRVLVAFDKFKGSLGARAACHVAVQALRAGHADWILDECPLTDGGDGFAEILTRAVGGRLLTAKVRGPRGRSTIAHFGLVGAEHVPVPALRLLRVPSLRRGGRIAVVEMAAASGLTLLRADEADPWRTSSAGVGQLIRAAAETGAGAIVLGVGGSATNDLGVGALVALGLACRTGNGAMVHQPSPDRWAEIARVVGRTAGLPPLRIACDVTNPLLGRRGATAVFGPQKGLRPEDRSALEQAVRRMADLLRTTGDGGLELARTPGAGAAGGLPFGLMARAGARLVPGFDLVSAWLRLPDRIAAADLVLTGEGRFDETSLAGKGPGAIACAALRAGKNVHVFAGAVAGSVRRGGWQAHVLAPTDYPLARAMREAPVLLGRRIRAAFAVR